MAKLVHSVRLSIPHVDRVRTPCTIRRPNPKADRARPQLLTTIALGAWGAGVLLTLGLARMHGSPSELRMLQMQGLSIGAALGQLRPADPQPEQLALADRPRDNERSITGHQTRVPQVTTEAPLVPSGRQAALPAPTPIAKPTPAVEAPAAGHVVEAPTAGRTETPAPGRRRAKRVFEPGIVAYVRCGAGRAQTPCLRDRKFEDQVWQTLAKLTSCSEAGTGSAELRWTLYKTDQTGLEWRPGVDGTSLNLRAVAKCAGEKLASTRTRLRSQQAVVNFRFSLK